MYKIVLASASPRRKEIFEQVGIEFDICPSNVIEKVDSTEPNEVCMSLARQKALDVASNIKAFNEQHKDISTPQDIMVVGADTIVSVDDMILGKPKDEADAKRMLRILSDNTNEVYTGVSIVFISKDGRAGEYSFFEMTKVSFYPLDEMDIDKYVDTQSPLDKAGAYGIQDMSARFIKSINGDYYNVVGFPIARFINELKNLGIRL